MQRACGKRVILNRSRAGVIVEVRWECPHCQFENPDLFLRHDLKEVEKNFLMKTKCGCCERSVTVECRV